MERDGVSFLSNLPDVMYAIVPLNIRLACMNIPKTMFLTKDVFLYKNGQEAKKCFMCFKQKKGLNDNLFYYYF